MKLSPRGWQADLLAAGAGALLTLSLAPFDFWPLGIVSCALLYALLEDLDARRAALRGWCFGLGLYLSGSSWIYVSIHVYGYAPAPLASSLTLLFCAAMALFSALGAALFALFRDARHSSPALLFAASWVLIEWLRSWLFTGFPWLYLGYAHLSSPLAGWAPIGGVLWIGFIVAASGALLYDCARARRITPPQLLLALLAWVGGLLTQPIQWTLPADAPALRVALVQANIDQADKWQPEQYQPTLALYRDMSAPLWADHDLVIWPEAAIPGFYDRAKPFLDAIAASARRSSSALLTGVPIRSDSADGQRRHYNSIVGLGGASGQYHKQRLVPFGEYVPLEQWLRGLIRFFNLPMSSFHRGQPEQPMLHLGKWSLAPFICYEIVYPDLVASRVPQAELLITISNDAWFGHSIGPLQHLQMAQMRALENGRFLLRATGSGVSAIIDPRGHIIQRGASFSREVISGEARIMQGSTPFAQSGSLPTVLLCWGLLLGAARRHYSSR